MWGSVVVIAYFAVATGPLVAADLREHRLPNVWTLPGWIAGLVGLVVDWATTGSFPTAGVVAGAAALVLFGLFAVVAGLGLGDVKLAVPLAIGLGLVGPVNAALGLVIAFASGGLAALIVLVRTRRRDAQLAFGPWLLLGFWVAAVWWASGK
ncbi:prepilin peptidase [Gulosibacter faecalis]|jgi:leader peptidase (prepilin peptidase)/N-methyltransferase|uniref:Prepilin peptidase n=1 Tax=Gulosibacter faecalis TaxID=272240 RepID=A0ABW5UY56_9MICO|nr:prepilin peptidase [Gulosibacter faecalis]